jgi:hypothetical protein
MRMFWRYAEIWLNPYCLRSVQSRINLNVTLNGIHHVGMRNGAPLWRRGHSRAPDVGAVGRIGTWMRAAKPRGPALDAAATSH